MTTAKQSALISLQSVADRLQAWAETAEKQSRELPDSEATPYRNQAANYTVLVSELRNAIGALKS